MNSDISNPFNSRDVAVLGDVQFVGATANRATFTLRDTKEAASERLTLRVDAHLDDVFRLRIDSAEPSSPRPDYGLLAQADPLATLTVSESEGGWRINMGRATLVIDQALLRISLAIDGRVVLSSITDQHFRGRARIPAFGRGNPETAKAGHWCVALALQSATAVYGFGEKFGRLDKRGQLVRGRIEDALGVNTELSYKNIPFCWSPDGWGLMVHTPGVVYHGVGYPQWSHRSYVADIEDAALDLFVFAGAPAEILNQYTTLTGRAALPPLWSYGMWLSRAYYKTPQEAIDTAAELRQRGVPCDVITLDGRAAWEVRTRFAFEWDKSRFDDPKKILATLRSFNLKVCAWEYPYVSIHNPLFNELAKKGWLLKRADGEAYVFDWVKDPTDDPFGAVLTPLPPSGVLDFTHPDAAKFWAESHNKLFDDGVDVIKTDFGEQVEDDMHAHNGDGGRRLHNVYPLLYNKCVYEATQRYNDQHQRGPAMVWGRDGFIGSQRYPIQWGGDPQTDWEGMAASIRAGLGYGMSGVPYYASDVGGFYGAQQPDTELYLRWTANGIFCSHFRYHGIGLREPWALGEETERIAKELLAFRYQLIPYIAGCAEKAARTGLPMMRAMPLAFPQERAAHAFELQYLFGDALLFAPIIDGGGETEVYFPRGAGNETWIDCLTGERIAGGEVRRVRRALNEFALFGREGHVLCLGRVVQHTGEIDLQAPIEEAWLFGQPKHAPCVMGSSVSLDATGNLRGIEAARCRRIDRQ